MKKFIIATAFLLVLAGVGCVNNKSSDTKIFETPTNTNLPDSVSSALNNKIPESPAKFISEKDNFKILFNRTPEIMDDEVEFGGKKYKASGYVDSSAGYETFYIKTVSVIENRGQFGPDNSSKQTLLKNIGSGAIYELGLFKGEPSLNFQIEIDKNIANKIQGFILEKNGKFYIINITLKSVNFSKETADNFFDSFEFISNTKSSNSTTTIGPNSDTDNDGLSDLLEAYYKTNPRNPDTDNDGYKDGYEITRGYNPAGPGKLNQ